MIWHAVSLVIMYLIMAKTNGDSKNICSETWKKKGLSINCSARHLTAVPEFSNNSVIVQLDLSSNNISNLWNSPFSKLQHLIYLDLSENILTCLNVDAFRGLFSLRYLSLYRNSIPLNNHSYPDGLFKDLKSLRILYLSRNVPYLDLSKGDYPSSVLGDLKSLKELHIDGLHGKLFGQSFLNMNLSKLVMSSYGTHCTIGHIPLNYFDNLPYLSHIDISVCWIKSVERGVFQSLRGLRFLDISGNQWLTFKSLYNITYGLSETNIQVLKISNIHCTGGIGTYLRTCQMVNIFKTKLTELYLDQNRLEIIEKGLLPKLPETLKVLSIAHNKLTMGSYMLEFPKLRNLEILNASLLLVPPHPLNVILQDCREDFDTPDCPFDITNGQNSIESRNNAAEISNTEIVHTNLKMIMAHLKTEIIVPLPFPPKLRILYYNNSRLYWNVRSIHAEKNVLEELYIQNNYFYEWHGPFMGLEKLKILDARNNRCHYISKSFLRDFPSMKILKLGNNMLGNSFTQDTEGEIFQSMHSAEMIDISKNEISVLSPRFLWNATNLRILDLKNNHISLFSVQIYHMRHLKRLILSNNKISSLDDDTRITITKLFRRNNASVDLSKNPIECSCENVKFLTWMHTHKYHFDEITNYKCSDLKQVEFNFSSFDASILMMQKQCTSYALVIVICATFMAVMITLVIARVVYKNRWKIRYFLYMTKLQYSGYFKLEQHNFDYDAFVSYAAKDRWFVIDHMIPILEKEKGMRFIIHDRDFIPGNDISDNIMAAIRNSRKTVCVISKHFFKSYWCTFEFNMACMENFSARKGEKIIFLILLEDIQDEDLQPKMLEHMEEKSYISVPMDGGDNVVFWNNIYISLSD